MLDIEQAVRSRVPGRLRLRHPVVRMLGEDVLEEVRGLVLGIDGVESVEVNPVTGSVLVLWDEDVLPGDELLTTLDVYVAMALFDPEVSARLEASADPSVAAAVRRFADRLLRKGSRVVGHAAHLVAGTDAGAAGEKTVLRRAGNRVMLGAVLATLLSLAVKGRGLHTAAGLLFTVLLLPHLVDHRKGI